MSIRKYILVMFLSFCSFAVLLAQDWNEFLFAYDTGNATQLSADYSVAISGVYAFIGTTDNNVIVCKYDGNSWIHTQTIRNYTSKRSKFGKSVSVWNDVLVVGAPSEGSGAVYMYRLMHDTWTKFQKITVNESITNFGYAVSIYNNMLAIGAPVINADTFTTLDVNKGRVFLYAYSKNEDNWELETSIMPSDARQMGFGYAVAVLPNYVLVRSWLPEKQQECPLSDFYLYTKNEHHYWRNISYVSIDTTSLMVN